MSQLSIQILRGIRPARTEWTRGSAQARVKSRVSPGPGDPVTRDPGPMDQVGIFLVRALTPRARVLVKASSYQTTRGIPGQDYKRSPGSREISWGDLWSDVD